MTFFGGRLFKGGVYTREAFITKYRKSYNSIYQRRRLLSEKRHYIICKPHNTPIPVLVQIVEEE